MVDLLATATIDSSPGTISRVLAAISRDIDQGESLDLRHSDREQFRLLVASTRSLRERAYRLAQSIYGERGYAENETAWCVSRFDREPQTFMVLAVDEHGADAATISLVFDSSIGMPCDEIFGPELHGLRMQGRRLVEVTRLAIAARHQRSKALLVRLFNMISVFARQVRDADDFVIEVNPRHADFYRHFLCFEACGSERPCPRVQGAPAALLRLDLSVQEAEVRRLAGKSAVRGERSLYKFYFPYEEEAHLADFLARNHRAMSAEDARYFGID